MVGAVADRTNLRKSVDIRKLKQLAKVALAILLQRVRRYRAA